MSRFIQRSYAPRRSSLRTIGIPAGHDALAVYLRWVRQGWYQRDSIGPRLPSSVGSVASSDTQQPSSASALPSEVQFDGTSLAHDLMCIGARFDEAEAGGHMAGYARELDILG